MTGDSIRTSHSIAGVSHEAYDYNSQRLNDSAPVIQALLNSNALYVTGNVPINATDDNSTTTDAVVLSTITPSAYTLDSTDLGPTETDSSSPSPTSVPPTSYSSSPSNVGKRKRQATSTSSAIVSAATINYLAAVMAARNNTVGIAATAATPSPTSSGGGGGGPNTGLAMIVSCPFVRPFRSSADQAPLADSLR